MKERWEFNSNINKWTYYINTIPIGSVNLRVDKNGHKYHTYVFNAPASEYKSTLFPSLEEAKASVEGYSVGLPKYSLVRDNLPGFQDAWLVYIPTHDRYYIIDTIESKHSESAFITDAFRSTPQGQLLDHHPVADDGIYSVGGYGKTKEDVLNTLVKL